MLSILLCLLAPLAAAQDRSFDSAGVRIRYVDYGSGAAVLLIHGFTADLERSWVETGILPDLARDHRVIAFDLRVMRRAMPIASQQAVEPSYIDALATSQPYSRATWVWNSNKTCSVPWAISGW